MKLYEGKKKKLKEANDDTLWLNVITEDKNLKEIESELSRFLKIETSYLLQLILTSICVFSENLIFILTYFSILQELYTAYLMDLI